MDQQTQTLRLRRRGMTVVEMMIACAVVVLLGIMTINFLVPAMALSAQGSIRAEMQQQSSIALVQMIQDLQATSVAGVSLLPPNGTNPTGFGVDIIQSASDTSQTWEDKVRCYFYYPTQKKLIRKTFPPNPPALGLPFNPGRPVAVSPSDLMLLANTPNGTEKTLAINVESFTVDLPNDNPVTIKMTLQQTVPHSQKLETLDIQRVVCVRNN